MISARISVCISTLDRPDALARCLESLAAGSRQPDEVVVVDQSTAATSAPAIERAREQGLAIEHVMQEGRGLSRSQNEAIRRARHEIVAVIDDDCVADVEWLANIARAFDPGDIDGVAGRVLPKQAQGDRQFAVASRLTTERRDFKGRSIPWLFGSGNNFAVRREWLTQVGGNDLRLGPGTPALGGSDMDLFYRLLRAGARLRVEPTIVVHHERQTRTERGGRRTAYGRGMGTAIGLWLRQRDLFALRALGAWTLLRTRLAINAMRRGDVRGLGDELTMLRTTVSGVVHGLRIGGRAPQRDTQPTSP